MTAPAYPAEGSNVRTIQLDTTGVPVAATVPVSEVFPAWQGEGPAMGQACTFLRLGLCNLHCSWCDTPFTWDKTRYDVDAECPPRDAGWIVDQVNRHPARLLIVSGGEPLMHRGNAALLTALREFQSLGMEVHVETNGTLAPTPALAELVDLFVVSPKIAQEDDAWSKRIKPDVLRGYADLARKGQACFKFVARTPADLHAVSAVVRDHDLPHGTVWVMPEGVTAEQVLSTHRLLAPYLEQTGFNTTTRLHVLLYGTQRGK